MYVPTEIKRRVEAELERCLKIAEKHFGREFEFPNVSYTLTGLRVAGVAVQSTYTVNFNAKMLMAFTDAFIKRTVPHELAHLIDGIVYPETRQTRAMGYVIKGSKMRVKRTKRKIHGPTWQSIMRLFGAPTSRCHSYTSGKFHLEQDNEVETPTKEFESKAADVTDVLRSYPDLPRADIIKMIALTRGVSEAYAQTLYYQAKKKIG